VSFTLPTHWHRNEVRPRVASLPRALKTYLLPALRSVSAP
jgi:hypothetical protein